MNQKKFNKKYFFGGAYENYDQFMDYKKIAWGLINRYQFQSFLDVGCGCGNLAKEIKKILEKKYQKKIAVYGLDFSRFAVKQANVPFIKLHDCTKPFPFKKKFDLVYVYTTLSYLDNIDDIKQAMRNIYNASRKLIVFDDVYTKKQAQDPDNYDPVRKKYFSKKDWGKLWSEVIKKGDKMATTKFKIIITKKN